MGISVNFLNGLFLAADTASIGRRECSKGKREFGCSVSRGFTPSFATGATRAAEVEAAAVSGGGSFGKVNVCWLVVWSGTWSGVVNLRGCGR